MIVLTMIVKDEAHVVARAINSARHLVDAYAIVDTGSTDGTEAVLNRSLAGLRGRITREPWTNYGDARTKSIRLAEEIAGGIPGYAFIVDADDIWSGELDLTEGYKPDAYAVWCVKPGAKWTTARLLKLGASIRYEGVVHEMPVDTEGKPVKAPLLERLTVTPGMDGATWKDPGKYLVHARALSQALAVDPTNTRNAFYLAQSYRDHGDDERAFMLYLARAAMGPSTEPEQVYCAYLEAGRALMRLGRIDEAKRALLNAHAVFAGRREAMAELARLFAVKAATSPTVGTLFVETGFDVDEDEEQQEAAQ